MSGDGMEDMWLWDSRGDRAYKEGRLIGWELKEYLWIQGLRKVAFCAQCGHKANYRYAPAAEMKEEDRWACEYHAPTDDDLAMCEWEEYEWL